MPLSRPTGNMYPFVSHTHSLLGGKCPHECSYCYVSQMATRWPAMAARYLLGELRAIEREFTFGYSSGRTIFIEHMNDLFAEAMPAHLVERVLEYCRRWPRNTYVFQTKNPHGYERWVGKLPPRLLLGTTLESNRWFEGIMGKAPPPERRVLGMLSLKEKLAGAEEWGLFVTVEPVLDCDPEILVAWIKKIAPAFVNVGADSKRCGLPEPSLAKLEELIERLRFAGIEVREKDNLNRLRGIKTPHSDRHD